MLQELNEEEEWLLEMLQKCRLLRDQKVEVRSLENILTRFIVNYLSESTTLGSTQTWHSLNADKGVLATKWSSTISAAITITVTVLAHLSLAHKACCVYNIQMNNAVNADSRLNTSTKS